MKETAYEMVIGLEVHIELKTATKIFCSCPTAFGAEPNTQCCPVCTGMPGTLPVLNGQVVRYAVRMGLATGCAIAHRSKLDRKNYFYPDLPKAYQISQYDLPLCRDGHLDITDESGETKRIGITRIHIEEDAGKLVHTDEGTLIDCNRCGVPLIEVVSEPDIRSAREAKAYLQKLRAAALYTGISDCRMNEGSMRCDVNLSVRRRGETALGVRTEMKNLAGFQYVVKAIEYEFARQVKAIEAGEAIVQETRRFDPSSGKTYSMRGKEDAEDYRYFPDPDLVPVEVSEALIEEIRAEIPPLPDERKAAYTEKYGLSPYAAEQICMTRELADCFEAAAVCTDYPVLAANLLLGDVLRLAGAEETPIPIAPKRLGEVAQMLGEGKLNSGGGRRLIEALWERDLDPAAYAQAEGIGQISDEKALSAWAAEALAECPGAAADYRRGKTAACQALIGRAMKKSGGRANPVRLGELIETALQEE